MSTHNVYFHINSLARDAIFPFYSEVDGNWGSWTEVSECSRSCGGGTNYRMRMCNNPSPRFGGNWCPGIITEFQQCNTQGCPGKICLK